MFTQMKFDDESAECEHADITLSMQAILDFVLAYSTQRQTQIKILSCNVEILVSRGNLTFDLFANLLLQRSHAHLCVVK